MLSFKYKKSIALLNPVYQGIALLITSKKDQLFRRSFLVKSWGGKKPAKVEKQL
jgi:hypothetical protein